MATMKDLDTTPIYIPKCRDGNVINSGLVFPAILAESPALNHIKKIAVILPTITKIFIVNPCTHKLAFNSTQEGKNFKAIGYPKIDREDLYSDPKIRTELVRIAIEDQNAKQSTVLIAPYLFAEDIDDTKFGTNLTLLVDSIHFLRKNPTSKPLFAMVHIGNSALRRLVVINNIIDRYTDKDLVDHVTGFFLNIDELDCEKAELDVLLGYAHLVFRLAEKKIVFVNNIGIFGEILCAVGAHGYISGVGDGEQSSMKLLLATPEEKKRKVYKRTYIPELFDYINDQEAKNINYKCNCKACKGTLPESTEQKKLHLLYTRQRDIELLQKIKPELRADFLIGKLKGALALIKKHQNDVGISFKTAHIHKWITVLESAKRWKRAEEDEEELELLLAEIDSKK
jgi:hypothetical protein